MNKKVLYPLVIAASFVGAAVIGAMTAPRIKKTSKDVVEAVKSKDVKKTAKATAHLILSVSPIAIYAGTMVYTGLRIYNKEVERANELAGLLASATSTLRIYKETIKEELSPEDASKIVKKVADKKLQQTPEGENTVVVLESESNVLFFDELSGRYFKSTYNEVEAAVNRVNHEIINNCYISLSDFYDEIGLEITSFSDEVGWDIDALVELDYTSTITTDKKPCIVISFRCPPQTNFNRFG